METTTDGINFDPEARRIKYQEERDKRLHLRPQGDAQYVKIEGRFARFLEDPYVERRERAPITKDIDVTILGGGFGGLLAAARLREDGIDNILIFEKGGDFGGTWHWNRYPGAACDVESYIPAITRKNCLHAS